MFSLRLSFEDFTAEGLALKDVLSTNPDGTTNNCSARDAKLPSCCAHMPPFEVYSGTSWTRVPHDQIAVSGSSVKLTTSAPPTKVRYAWADYVDCILVNSDGLPAGPFVVNVTTTKIIEQPKVVSKGLIQSPPMGTNTWNYYRKMSTDVGGFSWIHCQIATLMKIL